MGDMRGWGRHRSLARRETGRAAGEWTVALVAAALLLASCTPSAPGPDQSPATTIVPVCEREPSRPGTNDPSLQAILDATVADTPGGLILAFGRRGEPVRYCAAGQADSAGTALEADDVFRVGSITKTFTAVMILQLVDEGALTLDTHVEAVLPGVPLAAGVSVRQLLSHASGIPDFFTEDFVAAIAADSGRTWTASDVVGVVDGRQRDFDPGAGYAYSNTNYVVAGMLLEHVTGQTFAENLRARITGPLGLEHTALGADGETPVTGFSAVFAPSGNTESVSYRAIETAAGAAGGLVSTAPDVVTFYRALADGELLPPALFAEMTKFQGREFYGLGLSIIRLPSGSGFGHGGNLPGYLTLAVVRPESDDVVVIMTNNAELPRQSFLPSVFAAW